LSPFLLSAPIGSPVEGDRQKEAVLAHVTGKKANS